MNKTDSQLQEDVLEELRFEPSINASHIGVTAKDGVPCRRQDAGRSYSTRGCVKNAHLTLGVSDLALLQCQLWQRR